MIITIIFLSSYILRHITFFKDTMKIYKNITVIASKPTTPPIFDSFYLKKTNGAFMDEKDLNGF